MSTCKKKKAKKNKAYKHRPYTIHKNELKMAHRPKFKMQN